MRDQDIVTACRLLESFFSHLYNIQVHAYFTNDTQEGFTVMLQDGTQQIEALILGRGLRISVGDGLRSCPQIALPLIYAFLRGTATRVGAAR